MKTAMKLLPMLYDNENVVYLLMKPFDKTLTNHRTICKSIKKVAGKFLCTYEKKGLCLNVYNPDAVEKLLAMKKLSDGTPVEIIMHPTRNYVRRALNVADCCDLSEKEIQRELASQGVVNVRRIMKLTDDGQKEKTTMLVLTFSRSVKTFTPVNIGQLQLRTFPYYPNLQQCFNCWEFRHIKPACPKKVPTCGKCSGPHGSNKDNVCPNPPFCNKCQSGDHPISSHECPKYQTERQITKIRISKGVSHWEAKKEYEKKAQKNTDATVKHLTAQMTTMKEALEKKDREIKILRAIYETMRLEEAKNSHSQQVNGSSSKGSQAEAKTKKEPPAEKDAPKSAEEEQSCGKASDGTTRRKKKGKKGRGK